MNVSIFDSKLISRKKLMENIVELRYSAPSNFVFNPGQFVNITVNPPYRRPYSIISAENNELLFLVEFVEGGLASEYFKNAEIGSETKIQGPLGRFTYKDTQKRKVFISTGTGIAPFIPMIKELKIKNQKLKIDIFSGTRTVQEDFPFDYVKDLLDENITYTRCVSREESSIDPHFEQGRVTEVVPRRDYDFANTEFYICGSNDVVKDMRKALEEKGGLDVSYELYY